MHLIFNYNLFEVYCHWHKKGIKSLQDYIERGPNINQSFCYPQVFMILSHVMLLGVFINMLCNPLYLKISVGTIIMHIRLTKFIATLKQIRPWPNFKTNKTTTYSSKCKSDPVTKTKRLTRLAILSTLARIQSLPHINIGQETVLKQQLKTHVNVMGHLNAKQLPVPTLTPLQDYLKNDIHNKHDFIEGAFTYIVDTGCACSCSPYKEDFETLEDLPQPITLKGVTGEQVCSQGGIIKLQCINTKGDIVTIRTPGYHNPHQTVRLFSPQCHFLMMGNKKGRLLFTWAKTLLEIPNIGTLPVHIDSVSYMPLLTCFHDVDKVVHHLANPCVTDKVNPMLSPRSKLLLKLHYKLGHIGFQHLKYLLKHFNLFGASGVLASHNDTEIPKCSSCIQGGMERQPIKGNIHTNDPKHKGCLKSDKLIPGKLIFSDQYVSNLSGKHFNGKGQLSAIKGFKGGTVFCDAASSYISIYHQQSFTAHETIESLLAFERESAEVGNTILGYNTDNGVYKEKTIMHKLQNDNQTLRLSGVGAHHQNRVAKNTIKNFSRKARIYMFHATLRWPD